MDKRKFLLIWLACVVGVGATTSGALADAQPPIEPILTQTSRDGQLIGLKSNFQWGIWKPIAAVAYGLESGNIRYQAGLMLDTRVVLPGLGLNVGPFSAAFVDWFSTPVLGREGQRGLQLGLRLGDTRYTGFFGELWSLPEEEAPKVGYLLAEVNRSFRLPYELTLSSSSQTVVGVLLPPDLDGSSLEEDLPPEKLPQFQSMTQSLTLRLGELSLTGRWGSLQNEADLGEFIFTTGVRGIPQVLEGHVFWNVTLSRSFPMYEADLPLPLPPELTEYGVPDSMPLSLSGKFFVQAGGVVREVPSPPEASPSEGSSASEEVPPGIDVQPEKEGTEPEVEAETETEALFSWGISATLTIFEQFRLQVELIVTQSGETKFNVRF